MNPVIRELVRVNNTGLVDSCHFLFSIMSTNEVITRRLFRRTQRYHKKCLRRMFLQYYEPVTVAGKHEPNPNWTVGVNKKVMKDMRLHLTWVLKGEVFHWTDKQIGTRMLRVFHKLTRTSRSTFVNHVLL